MHDRKKRDPLLYTLRAASNSSSIESSTFFLILHLYDTTVRLRSKDCNKPTMKVPIMKGFSSSIGGRTSTSIPQRNGSETPSRTSNGSGLMSFSKNLAGFLEKEHLLDETMHARRTLLDDVDTAMHTRKTLLDGLDTVDDTFHTAPTTDLSETSSRYVN